MLSISLSLWINYDNKQYIKEQTATFTHKIGDLVKKRFELYEYGLLGARGAILVANQQQLTRSSFELYTESRNKDNEFPGALGFGFIKRVSKEQTSDFIEQARRDGAPEFSLRQLTPHQDDRFIIQYIYPQEPNKEAIGLDIGSEANRRNAAIKASLSNEVTLTAPITLVQATGNARSGFLMLLPVYQAQGGLSSPKERLASTLGWAYAPLIAEDVLFDSEFKSTSFAISISDTEDNNSFFESHSERINENGIESSHKIAFMGREWLITTTALPDVNSTLNLWAPVKFFIYSFIIIIGLSILLHIQLKNWSGTFNQKETHDRVDAIGYLRSREFKRMLYISVLGAATILVINTYFFIKQEFSVVNVVLKDTANFSEEIIQSSHTKFTQDLTFLFSTKPITMLRAKDDRAVDTSIQFEQLAEIFRAYMLASPNVFQVRLIQNNDKGTELVRVERIADDLLTADESGLQEKGSSGYFINAVRSNSEDVLISDIEPNKENDVVELPVRPALRYIKRVKANDGSLYALIVINVDARSLIEQIQKRTIPGEFTFLTNKNSEFILSQNPSQNFASSFGESVDWNNTFKPSSKPLWTNNLDFKVWTGPEQKVAVVEREVKAGTLNNTGKINVLATFDIAVVYEKIAQNLFKLMLVLILIGATVCLLYYFSWANSQRTLRGLKQKKELEDQHRNDSMFKALTELSPEAMVFTDINGKILLVNTEAEKLFGYSREKLIDENINILVPEGIAHQYDLHVKDYVNKPIKRRMGDGAELYSQHADGTEFAVEVSLAPIQLDDKLIVASSIRDVSKRKETEQILKDAVEETKRASQAKSSFLANMSHEIRTPLNAVIGLSHLLKEEGLSERPLNLVNKIQLAGRSLLGIVNDVLDLAKIEANEIVLNEEACQLPEILDELHSVFSEQAASKGLQLNVEIDKNLPLWVQTDHKILVQILTNLLGNSMKFTKQGSITISAHCLESNTLPSSQQLVRFNVQDTGIGINDEAKSKIFKPFGQEDASTSRRFGGTGLGLSIVTTLTDLLGGEIGVESEQGKGSNFWVNIPFVITDGDVYVDDYTDSAVEVLKIWVVDDDPQDRERLASEGKALGWQISSFDSGTQLIATVEEHVAQNMNLPDLLLVDWQMPEMDGLMAINILYKKLGRDVLPAIMVISAYDIDYISKQDHAGLVNNYLHKPASTSALFNAVNETVVKHTGSAARVLNATKTEMIKAKWLPNVKILVVDDSEINLEVVSSILERNGAIVQTADSGLKALELIKNQSNNFDIVLMDVQMPEMDGIEAVTQIRQVLKLNKLPVVALTAGTMDEERKRVLVAGMNDFLTKPVEPSRLINTIRKIVERYRGYAIMIEGIKIDSELDNYNDWPKIEGLTNSAQLLQGDVKLFTFTLQRLVKEYANIENMSDGHLPDLSNRETRLLLTAQIHKLRGISGTIGATELYDIASKTEIHLRNSSESPAQLLIELGKALSDVRENTAQFLTQQQETNSKKDKVDLSGISEIGRVELATLVDDLENNNLSASVTVEEYANNIKALIGEDDFDKLQNMMLNLEYEEAANLLKTKMS